MHCFWCIYFWLDVYEGTALWQLLFLIIMKCTMVLYLLVFVVVSQLLQGMPVLN